jgi:hypothetical protein
MLIALIKTSWLCKTELCQQVCLLLFCQGLGNDFTVLVIEQKCGVNEQTRDQGSSWIVASNGQLTEDMKNGSLVACLVKEIIQIIIETPRPVPSFPTTSQQ